MDESRKPRPFVGILFKCCHVYVRIYLNREGTAYCGSCPRCGGKVELVVSKDGSSSRFWQAG